MIVSDRIFTMNELRNMSSGADLILNTVRDQLKIRIMEHDKRKFLTLSPSLDFFGTINFIQIYDCFDLHFNQNVTQAVTFQNTKIDYLNTSRYEWFPLFNQNMKTLLPPSALFVREYSTFDMTRLLCK